MIYPGWQLYNSNRGEEVEKEWIIEFYKRQYLEFASIGIGGRTKYDVEITRKLIRCTENRLDQLIRGKVTPDNMCESARLLNLHERTLETLLRNYRSEQALTSSNRTFVGSVTPIFHLNDLDPMQVEAVCNYIDYADGSPYEEPRYIDKYTTAYNSELMVAILSHDN